MRRFLAALVALALYVAPLQAAAETIIKKPSGGGLTVGTTTVTGGTANRLLYTDGTTLQTSELERTDANTLKHLSTTSHICWNTATGIRLDAAGSLSFSNCSTGHATGLGLGTTTPKTYLSFTATAGDAVMQATSTSAAYLVAASNTASAVHLIDLNGTANRRFLAIDLRDQVFAIGMYADSPSTLTGYLSANLTTDVVTFGSASVTGLTLNPGTAADVVITDTKGLQVSGGGGVNNHFRFVTGVGTAIWRANGAGIVLDIAAIVPMSSGALADNALDLGTEADYRWRSFIARTSFIHRGGNGQKRTLGDFEESHTLAAAATSDTTNTIPVNSRTTGAVFRITTNITGCATVDAGIAGATNRFGTFSALTAGTTLVSTDNSAYASATAIRFSCVGGGGSFTAGVIRVTPFYDALTAPTS